jgi:tyrosyl-tRNA synthetase
MNGFDILEERGFIQQVTDREAVRALFATGEPVVAYIGYDPTAESLHVGNLFSLLSLVHLERLGHRPIVLLGGGTAMVGDPSGKTELRQMLSPEAIAGNVARIRTLIGRLLDVGGRTQWVDNSEWLLELSYIEFLREIGRHFSVNRMLAAEAYRLRLERGLSFIEFNYQLLQAYDFLQLQRRFGCVLQMGGDDQWGNILAGVDLCRRVGQTLVHGVTFPLLLTATGEKMGKTAAGAVWLDGDKLAPYEFYQYWVNTHDDDVERMLGYFTFLPMEEVRRVSSLAGADRNAAKSILAYEVTHLVHGERAALEAHAAAQAAFGQRRLDAAILPSSKAPRGGVVDAAQIPTTTLTDLGDGVALVQLLADVGLAASKNEARRLIRQNAVRLGDRRPGDENYVVKQGDFVAGRLTLRAGKKKVHRIVLL